MELTLHNNSYFMFMELAKYVLFHVIFLLGIYFMLCNISILLLYYSICLLDKMF